MGCTSSTEVVTNPSTGQVETKKKLGGAYPGQRRPQHATYTPDASQFDGNGQAVVHFKAYGGGNALTLVQQDGTNQPSIGIAQPEYVSVTLPEGVKEGQTIHVQAPDGKINAIVIPPGFGPGSTFTVEFAPDETTPSTTAQHHQQQQSSSAPKPSNYETVVPPVSSSIPMSNNNSDNLADDGFASGFGNPNYRPPAQAQATTNFSDSYYTQYPTAQATSVGYK